MKPSFIIWLCVLTFALGGARAFAQSSSLVIDEASLTPVNINSVTGLALDPIAKDRSNRPCARIKMHINRLTPEEIQQLEVRTIGGNIIVMKQMVAREGNGLIIELTAKPETRFYLHHNRLGDSNPVNVALEGNKEYRIEAWNNQTHSITVFYPRPGAEVYLDSRFRGVIGTDSHLTILDVTTGTHTLEVKYGADKVSREIDVSVEKVFFSIDSKNDSHQQGFIVFKVTPANALVEVDGVPVLVRDGVVQKLVRYGTYPYKVSAKGYHSISGQIVIDSGKVSKEISLRPSHGWISINGGNTDGAYVYIDSELIGQAPLTSDQLSSGTHVVRIVKPLFRSYETKVKVSDGETVTISPVLTPDYSQVTIEADEGADIWVNGEYKGTGIWKGELPAGDYIVESRKKGYHSATDAISITNRMGSSPVRLSHLQPVCGVLSVSSSPIEADIYCNNELKGQTPLFLNDLMIGIYEIRIVKDGYNTWTGKVTVKEDDITELNVTLDIETGVTGETSENPMDISAVPPQPLPSIRTANCYIISKGGIYSFPTVKGNSSESVGSVATAEVLWESSGTDKAISTGSLISSVKHQDGLITYEVPEDFSEGNAVIAAKDKEGRILWSWHIWLTDTPEAQTYARSAGVMMDRNLGAVSATPGEDGTAGLLFQWGRKDPFPGSSESGKLSFSTIDWPSPVQSSATSGTVSYAVEHPTTFITGSKGNNDWLQVQNDSLWSAGKTIYDPCPEGWRIPEGGPLGVWRFAGFPSTETFDASNKGISFLNNELHLWYPAAGYRRGEDGKFQEAGKKGYYWSLTPNGIFAYSLNLSDNDYVNISFNNYRSYAFAVRCIKED